MKKIQLSLIAFLGILICSSFINKEDSEQKINWITWEEAVELNKEEPKKIFVDVYTHWCGFCVKMDKNTFTDKEIIKTLNDNFYAVKFNAEQKEDIIWNGNTFKFIKGKRRGAHELASALLNGRLGYPSFVLLDEEFARIMISPGYKKPAQLMQELVFAKDEMYKEVNWEDYKKSNPVNSGARSK